MNSTRWVLVFVALSTTWVACGEDTLVSAGPVRDGGAADTGAPLSRYLAMEALVRRSCSFTSCHGGEGAGKARLNFASALARGESLTRVLNDVSSCEYPRMALVKPGAPEGSWLMVKLTAEHDSEGRVSFVPDPTWDAGLAADTPSSTCPLVEEGELSFGKLMPLSGTRSRALPEHEIEVFRAWIEAGAPAR